MLVSIAFFFSEVSLVTLEALR